MMARSMKGPEEEEEKVNNCEKKKTGFTALYVEVNKT